MFFDIFEIIIGKQCSYRSFVGYRITQNLDPGLPG